MSRNTDEIRALLADAAKDAEPASTVGILCLAVDWLLSGEQGRESRGRIRARNEATAAATSPEFAAFAAADLAHQSGDDVARYIADESSRSPIFAASIAELTERLSLIDALVERRKALGLTQSDIAERMGVKQATVSGFEAEQSDPKVSTVARYARAVGLRFDLEVVPNAAG